MTFDIEEWRRKDLEEWVGGFIPPVSDGQVAGRLEGFFETGTEGVIWAVQEQNKSYEGLHILKNGDRLEIFNVSGDLLFDLIIDLEWESGWEEYPLNPPNGQQQSLGFWVHGNQKGWDIDDWGHLFLDENFKAERRKYPNRLRGRLTRAK